ncbi:hypothetical protein [Flagellimonas sp. W118]|uniref:hypothetical protein n=1 Tax=Flagellimonas sp. W118 TaxID=3410791 RepID=UPI003BF59A08
MELEYILENQKKYTEEAVNAAIHILNLRNGKLPGLDSVDQGKIEKENRDNDLKNIEKKEKKKRRKDYYARRLLWFGISCVGCAFYFFAPTLFTGQESLIEKSGEIEVVKTLYSQVS